MSDPATEEDYNFKYVEGFPVPKIFFEETFVSAIHYQPRQGDLFIVSYPKCGTTWVQHIVALILGHGKPVGSVEEFFTNAPFLEVTGAAIVEKMRPSLKPRAIKVHLPYHLTPRSVQAKYIYVTRNPKDCCVSYYHHMKNMPGHSFEGNFDNFFEIFLSGKIPYGDYFDHLLGWYEHRNDPNVLFVTFEEMKENAEAAVLKLASFIDDKKYAEPMRNDRQKLANILKYSSFDYMKVLVNDTMDAMFAMSREDVVNSEFPDQIKKLYAEIADQNKNGKIRKEMTSVNFMRKGIIKDWKNHFSESQSKRVDEKFVERTNGTDIPTWWNNYMA